MLRRGLALASACAALRASVAQLPPAALPAAGIVAARVRHASGGRGRDEDEAKHWAARVPRPRGSAKSSKAPGKSKQARSEDSAEGASSATQQQQGGAKVAATPPPPAAPPPPRRVVDVPDRVTVKELARALDVPVSRVEAVLAELDEAATTDEEYVVPL
jgi:hypothetical protein